MLTDGSSVYRTPKLNKYCQDVGPNGHHNMKPSCKIKMAQQPIDQLHVHIVSPSRMPLHVVKSRSLKILQPQYPCPFTSHFVSGLYGARR